MCLSVAQSQIALFKKCAIQTNKVCKISNGRNQTTKKDNHNPILKTYLKSIKNNQ